MHTTTRNQQVLPKYYEFRKCFDFLCYTTRKEMINTERIQLQRLATVFLQSAAGMPFWRQGSLATQGDSSLHDTCTWHLSTWQLTHTSSKYQG